MGGAGTRNVAGGPFMAADRSLTEAHDRDGEATGFERVSEHVTPELACFVEVERYRAKVGGRDDITPVSVRVTSILRKEDGVWRLVHRHADPIISSRSAESVIQE